MYYIEINAVAISASFRIPEAHTFQQTLPLPPLTTLVGMMGAAGGMDFESAMNYRKHRGVRFSVTGTHKGVVRDLWKYQKVKSKETISAVLLREGLTDLEMQIYLCANDEATVAQLREWFVDPVYALTAGTSDDLLKVRSVSAVQNGVLVSAKSFANTILPGNQAGNYVSQLDIRNIPLMTEIYAPRVQSLPVDFSFEGASRTVMKREAFTFVDSTICLKEPIEALQARNKVVALL